MLANDDSEMDEDNTNSAIITANDGKFANVTLAGRTLYKDGAWNTLTLPFNATKSGLLADATIMELDIEGKYNAAGVLNNDGEFQTGMDNDNGILYLYFKNADAIEAGKPYIVKWANTTPNYVENPEFKGVTIVNGEPTEVNSTDGTVSFKGNYTPVPLNNQSILFLGAENQLYYPSVDVTLNAFRAYFDVADGSKIRAFRLNLGENDGEATGIMTVNDSRVMVNGSGWYTVDGVKRNSAPKRKGLYIHNGTKVVIK